MRGWREVQRRAGEKQQLPHHFHAFIHFANLQTNKQTKLELVA
jgi:hypothetical protein